MSLRDRDLISIQEARQAVERASAAQRKFAAFSQEQVDAVVEACANAATEAGEQLARTAVEETGYGNVLDKVAKNRLAAVDVVRAIRGMKTVGVLREDREKRIIEIAEPIGVVAAVIPSTNPTSTAIYKTLISLKARDAIVLSPHPSAMRCICETANVLCRAALRAGAPEGLIECLQRPTMQGTQELMKNRAVGVILATGGTGLVRAAYSSGRPAYGVGPGNVPVLVERTADVPKAVADIFAGKTFDYGTICSSEQSIVAEEAVRELALNQCREQGGYFLSADEIDRLGAIVFRGGALTPNPEIVGRAATTIAKIAGINVPAGTRVLIAKLDGVGRDFPLSGEKLSPILGFYSAPNFAGCIDLCIRLLQHGGMGHTAAIHSQSEAAVKQFGLAVPAFRVVVNSSAVHGSIGYSTNLFPAMTLGCGAPGGNITSDNIGPQHLMNVKRIAWESRPVEHRTIPAEQRLGSDRAVIVETVSYRPAAQGQVRVGAATEPGAGLSAAVGAAAGAAIAKLADPGSAGESAVTPDKQTIARIVERVFTARGIPRGGTQKVTPQSQTAASASSVEAAAGRKRPSSPEPPSAEASAPRVRASIAESRTGAGSDEQGSGSSATVPDVKIADFVCENDVRRAHSLGKKIFVGPGTIVTPSARDYGNEHGILVATAPGRVPSQTLRE